MEQIGHWLKPIVAMIILAGFFEMILPDNQLRSVTKMILGLVIIMFLLQPLAKVLNLPATIVHSLSGAVGTRAVPANTDQVIREGIKMRNAWLQDYQTQARQDLEVKIRRVIGLLEEVRLKKVSCVYEGSGLKKVQVVVALKESALLRSQVVAGLNRKIVEAVRLLTQLNHNQIEVRWGEPNEQ